MNDLVTVVIPFYNVEKYADRCIKSIINQSYKELEIILVDDGSPDKCGEICDEYAEKDGRIRVIHKKNGGLSDARNAGIEVANGKYITFIDSDDYVSEEFVERLYNLLVSENAQIAVCNFANVYENSDKVDVFFQNESVITVFTCQEAMKNMLYQRYFDVAAWGKIYNLNFFKDVRYPVGKLHEDIGTTHKIIKQAEKVVYCAKPMYFYLRRDNSITGNNFKAARMDGLELALKMMRDINNWMPECNKAAICRTVSICFHIYLQIENVEDKKRYGMELESVIKKNRRLVMFDTKARKKTRIACALTLLGFGNMKKIYSMMH